MSHAACIAIAFVVMLQASAKPLLFGNALDRVTADDLAAIAKVAEEPIWLMPIVTLVLPNGQQNWTAHAHLMPDRETPELRLGRGMVITNSGVRPDPSQWIRVQPATKWIQVAFPGRAWTDLRRIPDPNWPILVDMEISDVDLLSVVRFVRSGPVLGSGSRGGTRLATNRQITGIHLDPGQEGKPGGWVRVSLATETDCQDVLRLDRVNGEWSAIYTGPACG